MTSWMIHGLHLLHRSHGLHALRETHTLYGFILPSVPELLLWGLPCLALLVIVVGALTYWIEQSFTNDMPPLPTQEYSAIEVLYQRYARGEINSATFEQLREHLLREHCIEEQEHYVEEDAQQPVF